MPIIKKLFIFDWILITYILFCMLWLVINSQSIIIYNGENTASLFLEYLTSLGIIVFIILLWHFTHFTLLRVVRFWYPCVFIPYLFTNATRMDLAIFHEYLDPIVRGYDQLLFGYQPVSTWGVVNDTFFWQEFYHYAYFSYYLMLIGIPLYIYLKYDRKDYIHAVTNVLFVFYACLIVYLIFPVVGGRFIPRFATLTTQYRHGLFTHIMAFLYQRNHHWGGAFPSSHVAIALTLCLVSLKYMKPFAWVFILHTLLLAISTVFCHYHYFVDVITGFVYGFIMYGFSEIVFALSNTESRIDIDEW